MGNRRAAAGLSSLQTLHTIATLAAIASLPQWRNLSVVKNIPPPSLTVPLPHLPPLYPPPACPIFPSPRRARFQCRRLSRRRIRRSRLSRLQLKLGRSDRRPRRGKRGAPRLEIHKHHRHNLGLSICSTCVNGTAVKGENKIFLL